jgi:uncharacterized protein
MPALPGAPVTVVPTRHQLPACRPVRAAVLAWAAYSVSLAVWLVLPWEGGTESAVGWVMTLGINLTRVVVAVAFLSIWRLWRPAGFLTVPAWKRVVPALPLLLLSALPAIFGPGLSDRPGWKVAVSAFGVATVAFGEEGMFRGVVMRVLLVRGVRPALFGSAALFGLMHLVNLVNDSHPVTVAAQVIMTFGVGIGFGAVALATGTIWPLLVIHFLMDFINSIQAAAPGEGIGGGAADLLLNAGINVVLGALVAGYGLWLLHRRTGLIGGLDPPAKRTE